MKYFKTFLLILVFSVNEVYGQGCCSGGGNNPLAGTGPTGVLAKYQMEVSANNIFSTANSFYNGTTISSPYFERMTSNYSLLRLEYGLTDRITLSGTLGYYGHRTIFEHVENVGDAQNLVRSNGLGDFMFLPRYKLFSKESFGRTTELNIGLGVKIPLNQPDDSTYVGQAYFVNTSQGQPFLDSNEIWQLSPPLVQASTGSNDLMASFFFLHTLNKKYTFLASGMFINRGWNYLGIKYGNFSSIGLFLGRSLGKWFNTSIQVRGEWVGQIQTMQEIDYMSKYNIDKNSTGSASIIVSPLISINYKQFRVFTIVDVPVYQKMNGTQVAIPKQFNVGAAYRFYPIKNNNPANKTIKFSLLNNEVTDSTSLRDTTITVYGVCGMCKDRIEKAVLELEGVTRASYSVESLRLTLSYSTSIVNMEIINKTIAAVGHDTETHKAKNSVYNKLHNCCKYREE